MRVFFRWGGRREYDVKHLFPSYCRFVDALYLRPGVERAWRAEGLTTWPEAGAPPP